MRLRALAVSTACLTMAGLIAPVAAHAAGGETVFVTRTSTCSDTGPGTYDVPFCTIQAAADAAVPGDTVLIGAGSWAGGVDITKSGTAAQPIVFAGTLSNIGAHVTSVGSTSAHAFTVTASHIEIEALTVLNTSSDSIVVDGGSSVLLDRITVLRAGANGPVGTTSSGVHVIGAAAGVTLRRSTLSQATGPLVEVDGPATGTIISTNSLLSSDSSAIVVSGATGTAITSNTAEQFCGAGISATAGAAGTRIENNVLNDYQWNQFVVPCSGTASDGVSVDASATSSTTLDYNDVCWARADLTAYSWGVATYQASTDLHSATGQGAHDSNAAGCYNVAEGSPIIDSADSGAVGELPVDLSGAPRVDDPLAANTGAGSTTYHDRGAFEFQDPVEPTDKTFAVSAKRAPVGGTITVTASSKDTWGDPVSYLFYFGDGTSAASTSGVVTHSYTNAGTFQIEAAAVAGGKTGNPLIGFASVEVVTPQPLAAQLSMSAFGALTVNANATGTYDAWDITAFTFDFGDGTTPTSGLNYSANHVYSKPGTYTVTETITDSGGNQATRTAIVTTAGSDYTPYGPTRILDTRNGTGAPKAKLAGGSVLKLKIAGNGSIPASGVTSVALNVTVTNPTGGGYVSVYPDGLGTPPTSNLNFGAGQTVPASVITQVGTDGYIDLYYGAGTSASVDLIADVNGYFTQTAASGYAALAPARLLDTRNGTGAPEAKLAGGNSLTLAIAKADGGALPASGITAVALNVTVTNPTAGGYLTVYPSGQNAPTVSNLNFDAGQTVANTVVVPVGADGNIELYYGAGTGASVDLVTDVAGYFSVSAGGAYVPLQPMRVLDTRASGGPVAAFGNVVSNPQQVDQAISAPVSAYVLNLTVTSPAAGGYLTGFPYDSLDESPPKVSNLNFAPGQTIANLALIPAGGSGEVGFYNGSAGTAQIVADLFGYYAIS